MSKNTKQPFSFLNHFFNQKNINTIEVIDPEIINNNKTNNKKMKLSDLSPAERQQLINEAKAEENAKAETTKNNRKAYKELVGETVPKFFDVLIKQSAALSQTKLELFNGIKDLIALKIEAYGIKENQQSHSLTSEDGKQTIKVGYRVNDGWDDTMHAGIDKVNQFIGTLVTDEDTKKLVNTINRLLQKDANGNLKSNRVLELEKIAEDYNSPVLNDGIDIIRKAWKPVKSCYFIEAYYVNEIGSKQNVPLSISSVDFPNNAKINFI